MGNLTDEVAALVHASHCCGLFAPTAKWCASIIPAKAEILPVHGNCSSVT